MKRNIVILFAIILIIGNLNASIPFMRVGESYPNTNCIRIPGQEQLTGQQFQQDAIITYKGYQYTVYYNHSRNVCIAKRHLPLGEWQEIVLPYQNKVDDAHNVISMGICANDGTIHLAYDHHNDSLHYCRSVIGLADAPENIKWEAANFGTITCELTKGISVIDVTYPRFISKPDGNLLFECRFHYSGYGDSYLREYDGKSHTWSLIGRYIQGLDTDPDACAYINGMTYDNQDRLHVTWCWRDDFGGGSNHDFYYGYSEDHGRTWKDTYGNQIAVTEYMEPVVVRTTGKCMGQTKKSLMIEEIPFNKGYINQETQATDSKGRIHAVNSHMLMSEGTDSDWNASRKKAVLHHRFRDTDGRWNTRLIKNNGVNVNSYCRVHLAFDTSDNAYVIANGAEIYVATPDNDYDDWELLTDIDKNRFISEPHIDRPLLLSEGVLSYVYLAKDNKLTVVDYLLDNPHTPDGTGLKAEFFSDTNYKNLIEVKENVTLSVPIPDGTHSIRWSGVLETSYAEKYTLWLTTGVNTTLYIDNRKMLSETITGEKEIDIPLIASHKHTLVIECTDIENIKPGLQWSSKRVPKTTVPLTAFYSHTMRK